MDPIDSGIYKTDSFEISHKVLIRCDKLFIKYTYNTYIYKYMYVCIWMCVRVWRKRKHRS